MFLANSPVSLVATVVGQVQKRNRSGPAVHILASPSLPSLRVRTKGGGANFELSDHIADRCLLSAHEMLCGAFVAKGSSPPSLTKPTKPWRPHLIPGLCQFCQSSICAGSWQAAPLSRCSPQHSRIDRKELCRLPATRPGASFYRVDTSASIKTFRAGLSSAAVVRH